MREVFEIAFMLVKPYWPVLLVTLIMSVISEKWLKPWRLEAERKAMQEEIEAAQRREALRQAEEEEDFLAWARAIEGDE